MPPKAKAQDAVPEANEQDRLAALESKRLQDAAFNSQVLSKTRRLCADEVAPHKGLIKADGKDIVKRSAVRKNRYLLNVNAQLAAAAAGNMGTLAALDTKNPVLYVDFPEGRLKFFGTLVFPKNRYLVLRFGQKDIVCEDVLENMVVFAEAWWVGTKESNPEEKRLPIPESVLQAEARATDAAAAAKGAVEAAAAQPQSASRPRKRARLNSGEASGSSGEEGAADEEEPASVVRTSQRNRGARPPKYAVDVDEDADDEDGDDEGRDGSEGAAPLGNGAAAQPHGSKRTREDSSDVDQPTAAPAAAARRTPGSGSRAKVGTTASAGAAATGASELDMGPSTDAGPSPKPARVQKAALKPKARVSAAAVGDSMDRAISFSSSEEEPPPKAVAARRPARAAAGAAKAKLCEEPSEDEADGAASGDGGASGPSQDADSEFSL